MQVTVPVVAFQALGHENIPTRRTDAWGTPAVDPSSPQSWNRYPYVLNNPLSFVDPLGLDPGAPCFFADCSDGGGGGGGTCTIDGIQVPCGLAVASIGGVGANNEFDLLRQAYTPTAQTVITGWIVVGISANGTTALGGCGDLPNCYDQELPVYGTIYSYPNLGLLSLLSPPPLTAASAGPVGALQYQQYQGIRLVKSLGKGAASPAVWYLCGTSPMGNISTYAKEGGMKGAVTGAYMGSKIGASSMIRGGLLGGMGGFVAGVALGAVASVACQSLGVY